MDAFIRLRRRCIRAAFDFSRRAWFHRISAFGYSLGAVNVVASRDEQDSYAFAPVTLRRTIERNINEHLSGEEGLVATALLVGQRGRLSERVWRVMRTTGLAHLLALSGLHMGLVAGFMFFLFWRLLALSRFALDYNVRKIAAAAAFVSQPVLSLVDGQQSTDSASLRHGSLCVDGYHARPQAFFFVCCGMGCGGHCSRGSVCGGRCQLSNVFRCGGGSCCLLRERLSESSLSMSRLTNQKIKSLFGRKEQKESGYT